MNDGEESTPLDLVRMGEAVAWINLESALKRGDAPDALYVESLVADALAHRISVKRGWKVHRARLMSVEREMDVTPLMCTEMGPPTAEKAVAGRANPLGVSYFYGALDPRTAVAEMRPWRGARISVAKFEATQPLLLVDLTGSLSKVERGAMTSWASFMMARPVHRDDSGGYLATQLLATLLHAAGVEGIVYASAMRPTGTNVVLFSDSSFRCTRRDLFEVGSVAVGMSMLWDGRKPNGGW
jgi:RES domain-containing protein